jgi:protein phosphatase
MSVRTITLPNGEDFLVRRVSTAGRRCIYISDIHGEASLLRQLLDKVNFCENDLLFLLGDLCEKGTDSLEVLRLVMALSEQGNVYALQGNCDVWNKELDPQRPTPWLPGYLRKRAKTLVADLCREQGIPLTAETDVDALKPVLWAAYQPELRFLGSLPRVIETDRALLVHASLQQETPPYTGDAHALVKCDDFMGIAPKFQKWVVCGHMPVLNYCRTIGDCKPRLDAEKHIVSIDGGNVINGCGQLNAFIVEGETVSNVAVDKLPSCHATGHQDANDDPVTLSWSRSAVEILEEQPEVLRVRHLDSGRILTVPPKKLYYLKGDPTPRVGVYTTYRLPVEPGDDLKLWERYGDWAVCKKDGVIGWVPTALLDL